MTRFDLFSTPDFIVYLPLTVTESELYRLAWRYWARHDVICFRHPCLSQLHCWFIGSPP